MCNFEDECAEKMPHCLQIENSHLEEPPICFIRNTDAPRPQDSLGSGEFAGSVSARCANCGYTWQKGKDGSHSCSKQLKGMMESIKKVATGESQVADDDTGGLKWIADYISTVLD